MAKEKEKEIPKILLVEDDRHLRQVLEARLSSQGYSVVVAHDGKEGLSKVQSEKPNLVVLDVGLPLLNGVELCDLIKKSEKLKQIPVIMLTAGKTIGDWEKGLNAGADAYMNKPYNWDKLISTIKELI